MTERTILSIGPEDLTPDKPMGKLFARLQRENAEAKAFELRQRTAETLDAERYRYLRNIAGQVAHDDCGPMVCSGCGDNFEYLRGEEVDAEVDEAMAEWKAVGSPVPKN